MFKAPAALISLTQMPAIISSNVLHPSFLDFPERWQQKDMCPVSEFLARKVFKTNKKVGRQVEEDDVCIWPCGFPRRKVDDQVIQLKKGVRALVVPEFCFVSNQVDARSLENLYMKRRRGRRRPGTSCRNPVPCRECYFRKMRKHLQAEALFMIRFLRWKAWWLWR